MALTLVNAGDTFFAGTLNALINILQEPAGAQEKGKYVIEGNIYSTSAFMSCPTTTLSRNSTPVSLSIDTADVSPTNVNSPSTGHLTQGGGQIYASCTTVTTIGQVAGNTTWQY